MKEIVSRRSIRKFKSTPVEEEKLMAVLEAARLAPSGNNSQPWRFLVITDEEVKKRIVEVDHNQQWMMDAPVFIVGMADLSARTGLAEAEPLLENNPSFELKRVIRDTAVAIEHILLECEAEGLGTCWTGWYEQAPMHNVLDSLGVPNEFFILGVIAVGYADEEPKQRPRKAMNEIARFGKWI